MQVLADGRWKAVDYGEVVGGARLEAGASMYGRMNRRKYASYLPAYERENFIVLPHVEASAEKQ